jgi:hypothetical protein
MLKLTIFNMAGIIIAAPGLLDKPFPSFDIATSQQVMHGTDVSYSKLVSPNLIKYYKGLIKYYKGLLDKPSPSFDIATSQQVINKLDVLNSKLVSPNLIKWYKSGDNVLTVGSNNIYAFYFQTVPLKNTLLYWHDSVTFNRVLAKNDSYFSPDRVFKDVDLVYLTYQDQPDSANAFLDIYSFWLHRNYEIKESTDDWTVFRGIKY